MTDLTYQPGTRVKLKSLCGDTFFEAGMRQFCGKIVTIAEPSPKLLKPHMIEWGHFMAVEAPGWIFTREQVESVLGEDDAPIHWDYEVMKFVPAMHSGIKPIIKEMAAKGWRFVQLTHDDELIFERKIS